MPIAEIAPPNTAGWTLKNDPNPNQPWDLSLTAGVDYVINAPATRSKRLRIGGGRHVYIPDLTIDIDVAGGPMLDVWAGSQARDVFVENGLFTTTAGVQTDAIRGTHGSGGNISTGAGGTTLKLLGVRVEKLVGTDQFVHADGIQIHGGMRAIWMQDSTFQSGYVCLQLQREQIVTGNARNITALTRSGTTATVTVSLGLAISVGDWVEIVGTTPTTWRSTYPVRSIITGTAGTSVTKFTVFLGDGGQNAWQSGGTAQKSVFQNYVGDVNMLRVNLRRMLNAPGDPLETLTLIRVNTGRPDSKTSNAQDRTPLLTEAMQGQLNIEDCYAEPNPGKTLSSMMEPDDDSVTYSVARGFFDTSTNPDQYSWPNHPNITGAFKSGIPPGGDYASTGTALTIADVASASVLDNLALAQVHIITIADTASASVLDNVVVVPVAGDHTLVIQDMASASVIDSLDNLTVTQIHNLVIQDSTSVSVLDNATLTQVHTLVIQDAASASVIDNVAITAPAGNHTLVIQDMTFAAENDNLVLTQVHTLEVQDAASESILGDPDFTQLHVLAIQDADSASVLDNLVLVPIAGDHTLVIQDIAAESVIDSLDSVAVTQEHTLAIAEIASASTIDNLTVEHVGAGPGRSGKPKAKKPHTNLSYDRP